MLCFFSCCLKLNYLRLTSRYIVATDMYISCTNKIRKYCAFISTESVCMSMVCGNLKYYTNWNNNTKFKESTKRMITARMQVNKIMTKLAKFDIIIYDQTIVVYSLGGVAIKPTWTTWITWISGAERYHHSPILLFLSTFSPAATHPTTIGGLAGCKHLDFWILSSYSLPWSIATG